MNEGSVHDDFVVVKVLIVVAFAVLFVLVVRHIDGDRKRCYRQERVPVTDLSFTTYCLTHAPKSE